MGPIPSLFSCPKNWSKFSLTRVRLTQLRQQRYLWERVCPAAGELLHVAAVLSTCCLVSVHTGAIIFLSLFYFSLTAASKTPHGCMFLQACNIWHKYLVVIVLPHIFLFFSVFSDLLLLYSLVPSFLSVLPLFLSMIQLRKNGQGAPTQMESHEADCVNIPHTLQWVPLRRAGGESF